MRIVALTLLLGGCATSSGVFETSLGVYSVTSSAFTSMGGASAARGKALKEATAKCASMGKRMEQVDQSSNATLASGSADLSFRCV